MPTQARSHSPQANCVKSCHMVLGGKEECQTATHIATPTGTWLIYNTSSFKVFTILRKQDHKGVYIRLRYKETIEKYVRQKIIFLKPGMKSDLTDIQSIKK